MKRFDWEKHSVLITGIDGFLGSAIARHAVERGARVVGIIRSLNARNHDDVLSRCSVMIGDVTDPSIVRQAISANEVDVVIHLAAYSIVRVSARDPRSAYDVNIAGTVNVLDACRQLGHFKKIVVASSDKAYGDHEILPYTEETPLRPRNTYDVSKACMDMISRSYGTNYGMPVCVTRCSNIYGPGDFNLSRLVPNTIIRMMSGQPAMLYSDVESMEREFIYVDDVVAAYDAILATDYQPGEAYNIGGNGPVKISDVAREIASRFPDAPKEPQIVQRDPSFKEIRRQYIDASKLTRDTGWKAKVSLDDGIHATVAWYRKVYGGGM